MWSLHDIANSFRALDKYAKANLAATECLERNRGRALETCRHAPDFSACFVCQRGIIPDSLQNTSPLLPVLQALSSPQRAGADASLTPAETSKPTGETVNVPVRRKRDKVLEFFRRNRAQ